MKKKLTIIPTQERHDQSIQAKTVCLRVAAYCRVSTVYERQENSYDAQVACYMDKIANNPDWVLAGIYSDNGRSATNTKKRDDFNALIDDCAAGKIDLVITKSVSRFARNTVDSLLFIRKLKEMNIGVIFEKEGINTLESTGELLITVLSGQAQEESRNISENTRWGIVRQFEKGVFHVNYKKFMGYTMDENGQLIIVPEEAEIVRMIFQLYMEGRSYIQICQALENSGIKTVTGNSKWRDSTLIKMLSNEKYMGDALLQKTYTINFLTKKRVVNKGIVPQYYVKNNHEAIIPADLFQSVQDEKLRRINMSCGESALKQKYSALYAISNIMICGECGYPYRRVTRARRGKSKVVWRCKNRLMNGNRFCTNSPTLDEGTLHKMIAAAINRNAKAKAIKDYFLPANQYDDRLSRVLIERIKVKQDGKLRITFKK
ncbi:Resolvase domain protein [Desulfofarcimen acetoxidans DSM 771]|uniref:Resolvase domain protein n=1 Tax=Desulfofarcimen acetoxidans (strain ATCC 49208 / DSM 771 / KCTC 5769 / VKM B-1644 / 5575) TaxID=485916 RepID=C8VVS6_DESAS|nr:Resolvase domain protein [Desulfofarcimen acetoxidans DSM 771]